MCTRAGHPLALDDYIVRGRRSGEFDHYAGISAGSMVAASRNQLAAR